MKEREIKPTIKNKDKRIEIVDSLKIAGLMALGFGFWGLAYYWVFKSQNAAPGYFASYANAAFADVVLGAIPVAVAGDKASTIMAEKTINQQKEWENFLEQPICDEDVDLWSELM